MQHLVIVASVLIALVGFACFFLGVEFAGWKKEEPIGTMMITEDEDGAHLFLSLDEEIEDFCNYDRVEMNVQFLSKKSEE